MKIQLTLKDPDGVSYSLERALEDLNPEPGALTDVELEEWNARKEDRLDTLKKGIKPWIEYDEYVTIEIDTTTGTATVLPVK